MGLYWFKSTPSLFLQWLSCSDVSVNSFHLQQETCPSKQKDSIGCSMLPPVVFTQSDFITVSPNSGISCSLRIGRAAVSSTANTCCPATPAAPATAAERRWCDFLSVLGPAHLPRGSFKYSFSASSNESKWWHWSHGDVCVHVQVLKAVTSSSTTCLRSSVIQRCCRCSCPLAMSSRPRCLLTVPPTRASASVRDSPANGEEGGEWGRGAAGS